MCLCFCCFIFFFKQKTAYEMRISDWSSDVCSSDLHEADGLAGAYLDRGRFKERVAELDIDRARGGVGFGGGADAFAVTGAGLGREDGEAESAGEKGGGHKGRAHGCGRHGCTSS